MFAVEALQTRGFCPMCDTMSGWGWFGMLIMAAFWIAAMVGVVWVVVRLMNRDRR